MSKRSSVALCLGVGLVGALAFGTVFVFAAGVLGAIIEAAQEEAY